MGLLNSKKNGSPHSNKFSSCPVRGQIPDWTTARTDGLLTGFIVTSVWRDNKCFFHSTNVPNVALNLPEGARLNHLWELRKPWGAGP